ncbi:50S ribosomal protein L11 methyltransferase [Qipengyuania sp.]|uniref:50S ribosomal protein L11 methyltransferase n=1 Tax=Qipengyuania sp. TaxID=2004515 RepID=UPI0037368F46
MSADSWKVVGLCDKASAKAALTAQEGLAEWPDTWVVSGMEIAEDRPDEWSLEVYLDRKPGAADLALIARLFGSGAPELKTERLPETDWVVESQKGVEPIRAGRFHIRTPDHPADGGMIDLVIPASQAFGTGQHETTAGCLAMLDLMRREGVRVRDLADIGTGTGLLAMAALRLWPDARATASDIDPVCAGVVADNLAANGMAQGPGRGALLMTIADGMDDPLIAARGPFDLIIANILAAPLVELAPDFGAATRLGGHLLLAGLLTRQEEMVRRAAYAAGFRLARRMVNGDWSILWLRRRRFR